MHQQAIIVTDLGYGDAGKGSIVDFLTREAGGALVVRHNGGAQAAHNVVTPDGRHHTFAQFGSGMFHPRASTFLSRYMIIDPLAMRGEAERLDALGAADVRSRTVVDPGALVATPFQAIVNRIRERRRAEKHGSCGCGVGESVADSLAGYVLRAGDLADASISLLRRLRDYQLEKLAEMDDWRDYATLSDVAMLSSQAVLETLRDRYAEFAGEYRIADRLAELVQQSATVIFEGAQGVLLDEWYGFTPYTTWSTTTAANALALLDECGFGGEVMQLGVVRTYMTRHGAGPLVTESAAMNDLPERHNGFGEFQGAFRRGQFDAVALRYALAVNGGVDALAVTHCDLPQERWEYCSGYRADFPVPDEYFTGEGAVISGIRVKAEKEDLRHQEALTRYLERCRPSIRTCDIPEGEAGRLAVCDEIGRLLGVRVGVVSWGATAGEKRMLPVETSLTRG